MRNPTVPLNAPDTLVPSALRYPSNSGRRNSNLAFALRTLPPDRRRDALVFYDFCRLVDDIADVPGIPLCDRLAVLQAWRSAIRMEPHAPKLPPMLEAVITNHGVNRDHLVAIVDGVLQDLKPRDFQTFDDLHAYCWRVASAVGLVSIRIFGIPAPAGVEYAEHLGIALQLTNIIRDVGEDSENGRIYLPLEDLARFEVSREDILTRRDSPAFRVLIEFQIERAQGYYIAAEKIRPTAWPQALRPSDLMKNIYARLLRKISDGGKSVLHTRYRLSRIEKLCLLLRA